MGMMAEERKEGMEAGRDRNERVSQRERERKTMTTSSESSSTGYPIAAVLD